MHRAGQEGGGDESRTAPARRAPRSPCPSLAVSVLAVTVLTVTVLGTLALPVRADDSVRRLDGKSVSGKITRLDRIVLAIEQSPGVPTTIPLADVGAIAFDGLPFPAREAARAAAGGDFPSAADAYRAAIREAEEIERRGWVEPQLRLGLAAVQRRGGDLAGALASSRELIESCSDCWARDRAFAAALETAAALRQQGDAAAARAAYTEIASWAEPANRDDGLTASERDEPHRAEATIGILRCWSALGREAELEAAAREALAGEPGVSLALEQAAGAALGKLLYERSATGGVEALRDALLASTRALAAGPPASDDGRADYLQALLAGARSARDLAAVGEPPAGRLHHGGRSAELYRELVRAFPGTEEARIAARELEALESRGAGRAGGGGSTEP